MPKDYAKRVFTTRRKPKKNGWVRHLLIFLLVLIVVWMGYQSFIHRHIFHEQKPWWSKVKMLIMNKTDNLEHNGETTAAKLLPPKTLVHFDFYNELPNIKVENNDPVALQIKTTQDETPLKSPPSYILQFGLFQDELKASQLRLSLLLSGVSADLIKVKTKNGTIFKIQQGPFKVLAQAKKLQRQLEKKGINSTLQTM